MAKREVIVLTDDLDGSESDDITTIQFGLDGALYEVDLTPANRDRLVDALTPFLDVARKSGKSQSAKEKARAASNRDYDPKAVRAWAQSNNVDVPDRGRIPAAVVDKFKAAGSLTKD